MFIGGLDLIWSFGEKWANCSSDRSGIWFKNRLCYVVYKVHYSAIGIVVYLVLPAILNTNDGVSNYVWR